MTTVFENQKKTKCMWLQSAQPNGNSKMTVTRYLNKYWFVEKIHKWDINSKQRFVTNQVLAGVRQQRPRNTKINAKKKGAQTKTSPQQCITARFGTQWILKQAKMIGQSHKHKKRARRHLPTAHRQKSLGVDLYLLTPTSFLTSCWMRRSMF